MDAPSSYFFGLERTNGQKRVIHSLLSGDGRTLADPDQVRDRAVEFFSSLYSNDHVLRDQALQRAFLEDLPQVPTAANAHLDGPLTEEELRSALMRMQSRRAPGIDGLSVEFYKAFWDVVGSDLLEVLNDCLSCGQLPTSCRRAVVTLLPKKGNLQDVKNWRPVSLLCVDYKILSKALATRLGVAMEYALHRDQTYCVPGRSMVDNVHLVRDSLDVCGHLGIKVGLISLDQEKAFDRVDHDFLWSAMEGFGFCAGFVAKVRVLYSDAESLLKLNGRLCAPFRVYRGVRQGCALSGMLYALSLEPLLRRLRSSLRGLVLPGCDNSVVLSAYADDVVVFVNNQYDVDALTSAVRDFGLASGARVNWLKCGAFAAGGWAVGLPTLPQTLQWRRDSFRYLGIFLGGTDAAERNWEGVEDRMVARLDKWRWLLPHMSFRGRVLVVNNLVASQLWHRLACMEPPPGLLARMQKTLVDFFWDGLHWVPRGVLYLPREEGGQGLVDLASRAAAFRLQFIQKFLAGPADLVWRDAAGCILRRTNALGMDAALFLIDSNFLRLGGSPSFYRGVFDSWALISRQRSPRLDSLHWLLEEPLVYGARLDISACATPGLSAALVSKRVLCLRQLVGAAGPSLSDSQALSSLLGLRSVRVAERLSSQWMKRLSAGERGLLEGWAAQRLQPDRSDPFPDLLLAPALGGLSGPLLQHRRPTCTTLRTADKAVWYTDCVKAVNRRSLAGRPPTVWSNEMAGGGTNPQWRILYKPPLKKRTADLQWRLLHGAVAVNNFVSVINRTVSAGCPFCNLTETVCHAFTACTRLTGFFTLLTTVFALFGVAFTAGVFINGTPYQKAAKDKWQLLNYLSGEAKMAIYLSRRNRVENRAGQQARDVWLCNIRARLCLEFKFYKLSGDLEGFQQRWCFNNIVCSVLDDKLVFAQNFTQ